MATALRCDPPASGRNIKRRRRNPLLPILQQAELCQHTRVKGTAERLIGMAGYWIGRRSPGEQKALHTYAARA
jgi:hypothetical protein